MVKLGTRLLALILIGVIVYLYVQVTSLQRQVEALRSQSSQVSVLKQENARLRAKLALRPALPESDQDLDWLSEAREHVLNAERAAAAGNFGVAYQETQMANRTLSEAANSASSETRQSVELLRSRLRQVQTVAQSAWHQLGN